MAKNKANWEKEKKKKKFSLKEKVTVAGLTSAFIGGLGTLISVTGICCVSWGIIIAIGGTGGLILTFLSDYQLLFVGVALVLLAPVFLSERNRKCKIPGVKDKVRDKKSKKR